MTEGKKPIGWLHGEIKTPPFSAEARIEAGCMLGRLQRGELLAMPYSGLCRALGRAVHELRVKDARAEWRIIYRIDPDAILVVEVFCKKTRGTPIKSSKPVAGVCSNTT